MEYIRGQVNFLPLLCLLFIGLKLGGVITWSWVWVLMPLWIIPVIVLAVFIPIYFLSRK